MIIERIEHKVILSNNMYLSVKLQQAYRRLSICYFHIE